MSEALLPFVEITTGDNPKHCVIWLHGLGDSGHGFAPIVPQLQLPETLPVKFIFPHAPQRAVTINGGMRMRAWYDIKTFDLDNRADIHGVEDSTDKVAALMQAQIDAGFKSENIVLAGFSQGGVIALHLGTRTTHKLAGIMGLSTYMCAPASLSEQASAINKSTPVMMGHGTQDEVVPVMLGKMAYDALQTNNFNASWTTYPMQHNVCMEEIQDISNYLQQVLV